jgi:hypothetical protein
MVDDGRSGSLKRRRRRRCAEAGQEREQRRGAEHLTVAFDQDGGLATPILERTGEPHRLRAELGKRLETSARCTGFVGFRPRHPDRAGAGRGDKMKDAHVSTDTY